MHLKEREIVFILRRAETNTQCNALLSWKRQKKHLKWELSRRDYWPSNRVLASTLRLNPYSITVISGDVPLPCPACLQVHRTSGRSFRQASDHWGVTGSRRPTPFRWRSPPQLKSIRPSPVKQPLRKRRAPLSFSLIPGLKVLIGTPRTESSDPQLSH